MCERESERAVSGRISSPPLSSSSNVDSSDDEDECPARKGERERVRVRGMRDGEDAYPAGEGDSERVRERESDSGRE